MWTSALHRHISEDLGIRGFNAAPFAEQTKGISSSTFTERHWKHLLGGDLKDEIVPRSSKPCLALPKAKADEEVSRMIVRASRYTPLSYASSLQVSTHPSNDLDPADTGLHYLNREDLEVIPQETPLMPGD